ncbi:unnamed protein product [Protopolystoma xenopodis]|uniref:Uncharacterized protein n=1 Tax=Protopolystoma xenopodis TaxID=117903 RepID=A0A3S5BKY5_9PLAT|nr:unnamed protein product [Protopolystoma xenopodis]
MGQSSERADHPDKKRQREVRRAQRSYARRRENEIKQQKRLSRQQQHQKHRNEELGKRSDRFVNLCCCTAFPRERDQLPEARPIRRTSNGFENPCEGPEKPNTKITLLQLSEQAREANVNEKKLIYQIMTEDEET